MDTDVEISVSNYKGNSDAPSMFGLPTLPSLSKFSSKEIKQAPLEQNKGSISPRKEPKQPSPEHNKGSVSPRKMHINDSPRIAETKGSVHIPKLSLGVIDNNPYQLFTPKNNKKNMSLSLINSKANDSPIKSPRKMVVKPTEEQSKNNSSFARLVKQVYSTSQERKGVIESIRNEDYFDIFEARNYQLTDRRPKNSTSKREDIDIMASTTLINNSKQQKVTNKRIHVIKTLHRAKGSLSETKSPKSFQILTDYMSPIENGGSQSNTARNNKESPSGHNILIGFSSIVLSPENIQRVEHEYVESNQLLSNRFSESKLNKTKHNMFRTYKRTNQL